MGTVDWVKPKVGSPRHHAWVTPQGPNSKALIPQPQRTAHLANFSCDLILSLRLGYFDTVIHFIKSIHWYQISPILFLTSLHWTRFPRQWILSSFAGTLILDLVVRLISHLYFNLGSISHFIKFLIQTITHLVTSSIDLGFTSLYTLRTSSSIDLILCLGLISPVGSRSRSPPLLSWAKLRQH